MRYTESVRGADVFMLQSHHKPINKAIMEQLITIDALEAAPRPVPLLRSARWSTTPVRTKKHRARSPSPAVWCSTC